MVVKCVAISLLGANLFPKMFCIRIYKLSVSYLHVFKRLKIVRS